jgi:cardiolipin synthase A/B
LKLRRDSRRVRLLQPALRPVAGRSVPFELRPGRVGRIAEKFGGLEDPAFEVLLRRITQSPITSQNRVELFFQAEAAFAAMIEAIAAAREEVLAESYIFRDDAAGRRLLEALRAAVARGVTVRVLADAVGSFGTRSRLWGEMAASGIDTRLFQPILSSLFTQHYRDHRKILVVDRRVGFTGGINIGEEWAPRRRRRRGEPAAWRDTHARVEGPAAWELAVVFSEGWSRAGGREISFDPLPAPDPGELGVLVLDSWPGRGHVETASVLSAIVGGARRRVWITNSYFAPKPRTIALLGRAARRGLDVRLLLPGPTDVPLVRHAGHGYFRALLRRGVRVFEYQPAILHAKTLVADDTITLVGSSNLDFRSFHYNAECNLVIVGGRPAGRMAEAFERDLGASVEITRAAWRNRGKLHRLGDILARNLAPLL